MEINALFDLWNDFTKIGANEEDAIIESFYTFPMGTAKLEIIGWFAHQNELFRVQDTLIEGRRTFSAINNPATRD